MEIVIEIPDEIKHYSMDIQHFVEFMIHKLWIHRRKGHWEDININEAMEKLRGEITELESVLNYPTPEYPMERDRYFKECCKEAADVANYALIICSSLKRQHHQYEMDLARGTT